MKTIAVTIDDHTLALLEELAEGSGGARSRSSLVRRAVREFAQRERQREIEARDARVIRAHRARLAKEARALVAGQARE